MNSARFTQEKQDTEEEHIRPLGWWGSLLYFGIPTLLAMGFFYVGMPALLNAGMLPYYAYSGALLIPLVGLLVAALIAYRLEDNPMSWTMLRQRFRWFPMDWRSWRWTVSLFLVSMLGWFLLRLFSSWMIEIGIIPIPENLPAIVDPRSVLSAEAYELATGGLKGNWLFLLTTIVLLFFNIVGEEAWWRGYILPRQELAFGRWTWLIHALFWTAFHAFKWWDLLSLLPFSLGLSYLVWRLRNNTPGIAMHTMQKLDFFIVTLPLFLFGY